MSNVIEFKSKKQSQEKHRLIGDILDEMDKYGMEISQMDALIRQCRSDNQSIVDVCLKFITHMQNNATKCTPLPYELIRELNVLAYVLEKGLRRSRL